MPTTAGQRGIAPAADIRLVRRPHGSERDDIDRGADVFRSGDGARRQPAQDRFETVMTDMIEMVRLRRGEEDFVDPRPQQAGQQRVLAGAKGVQHFAERVFEIAHRADAGVERRENVDEHNLAIETSEMIAEERPHHMAAIGIVAARHHAGERLRSDLATFGQRQRGEGEQRRTFEIARHQKPPRRQGGRRDRLGAAGAQIGGEEHRRFWATASSAGAAGSRLVT